MIWQGARTIVNPIVKGLCFALCLVACDKKESHGFQTIHSFAEIDTATIDKDTLVVLDADETLIQPEDTYLVNENSDNGKKFRERLLKQHPHLKESADLPSIMVLQAQRPLTDIGSVGFVKTLKEKGINVIVCTGMNAGKYGLIPRMEVWRYDHLRSLGIEVSFPDIDMRLDGFTRHPVFYKGILATDLDEKGPVLTAFLKHMKLTPRKLVMVDDTPGHLASVKKSCDQLGIAFKGYLYKGAKEKTWDEGLAQFQADYLIKHKKWLSDEEARDVMKKEGVIITTPSHETIQTALESANKSTLVIFDVDDVLLKAKDQIFQKAHRPELDTFNASLEKRLKNEDVEELYSITLLQRKAEAVEPQLIKTIQSLQERGIRTLALTNAGTGRFGKIPAFEDWRINEMKNLGYHFDKSWLNLHPINLTKDTSRKKGVLFKDGMIFTSRIDKGEALESFLNQVEFEIARIKFNMPRFSDYPSDQKPFKKAKTIDLKSHSSAHTFRTVLRNGFKEGKNSKRHRFGGHFLHIDCGCGTSCQLNWIVDLRTGKIVGHFQTILGVSINEQSRLIVLNPPCEFWNTSDNDAYACHIIDTDFYVVKDESATKATVEKLKTLPFENSKSAGLFFNKIIFIDDKRENLESVRKFCQKSKTPFVGIEYTAVKDAPATPLNKERAAFQFKLLEEEKRWLSDEEAETLMKEREHGVKNK